MDYVLTEHAREVMAKRRILPGWIELALSTPEATEADPIDNDLEHRLVRVPDFGNRVLRVIGRKSTPPEIGRLLFESIPRVA